MKEQVITQNERQKRLIEVYNHLRQHSGIHTKSDFAEAINSGRTSVSAALHGNEKYLTNSFFKNVCNSYPGVFSLTYLLTGEGKLLLESNEQKEIKEAKKDGFEPALPVWATSLIDLLTKQVKKNEELCFELKQAISELKQLKDSIDNKR